MGQTLKVAIVGDASSYARALNKASGETSSFGKSLATLGKYAVLGLGAAGVGGALLTLKQGFQEVASAQKVAAQTSAVLKSTGEAAHVSAKQVEELSSELLAKTGIDDEVITSGQNMLLTFTNVRNEIGKNNDIFTQATKVGLDMSTAMEGAGFEGGNLKTTMIRLGKALNDPVGGMTALKRVGVTFTDDQKKMVKQLVASGHTLEAQKLILAELTKEFGGSAEAAGKTLPGKLSILKEQFNNLAGSIVGGLIPALTGGVNALNKLLGNLNKAQGLKAKIVVAAQFVWSGLTQGVAVLQKEFSALLFGSFQKGGGVGPEGIKFSPGLVAEFTGALAALDWSAVGQAVIDSVVNAIGATGAFAKKMAEQFTTAIKQVPWEQVGRVLGPGFAAMIAAGFVTLTDPAFWARNWDLALAIALVAFGGAFAKIGTKIGGMMLRVFDVEVTRLGVLLANLSPKLAQAVVDGLNKLPGLLIAIFSRLTAPIGAIFAKIGSLATFIVKVAGVDVAINAIAQFGKTVGDTFSRLAGTVGSALNTAWDAIVRGALIAAKAIVEPFSRLPFGLGSWAQKAKVAIQAQLDNIDLRESAKHVEAWGSTIVLVVRTSGLNAGRAAGAGVAAGLLEYVTTVANAAARLIGEAFAQAGKIKHGSGDWMFTKKEVGVPLALGIIEGFTSVMATRGREFAKAVAGPWYSIINTLGPALSERLVKSIGAGIDKATPAAIKGLNHVGQLIVAAAKKYGVDARAALAVAMGEGGIKFGAVGDSGHAFGPFQFNNAGGVATGKSAAEASAWANSAKGVADAIRMMAEAGAKGKTGLDAITAIVRNFERPLDPSGSIRKAAAAYKELGPQISSAIASGTEGVKKTISGQLTALAALVKQYAPQIGIEHARGIITGLVGKTPDIVAAAKAQMEKVVAAMAAAAQARTELKDAFKALAQGALAAFDTVTDAWVPPAQKLLDKMQLEDQINAAVGAVAEAQARIDAAVNTRDTLTRSEGESDADFAARVAAADADIKKATEDLGAAQRSYDELQLGLRATAQRIAHEKQRAADREDLALDLIQLQTYLDKHPEAYAATQRKIIALMKKYHVPLFTAGQKLAQAFADGLDDGISAVITTAKKLVAALEAIPGVGNQGGGGGGVDPNSYGPRQPNTIGGTSSGRGNAAGGPGVVQVVLDSRVVAEVTRRQDGVWAQNNALAT